MLYAADTRQENVTPRGMIRSKIAEFKRMELKCRGLAVRTKKIGPVLKKRKIKYICIQRQGEVIVKCMRMKRMGCVIMINEGEGGHWTEKGGRPVSVFWRERVGSGVGGGGAQNDVR